MHTITDYQNYFISHLSEQQIIKEPTHLYEPIDYILQLGGKRLRPVLVLMTAEIFGESYTNALDAALAIEVFHNFSLVHDDIMDAAPLRRGKETVHEKWDVNTGILSGDAMLINAYQCFEGYEGDLFRELTVLFSKTAMQVCEGQQYDVDFETREDVTIAEYLHMIAYKTAVLVGAAMQMGAIIAQATTESKEAVYEFGRLLGIAFQLQDDYLDAFGDPATFGKQVGGDIIENKKTYLYLKAMEMATENQQKQLAGLYTLHPEDPAEKIQTVMQIFEDTGAKEATREAIQTYTDKAFQVLVDLPIAAASKQQLQSFGEQLMYRTV